MPDSEAARLRAPLEQVMREAGDLARATRATDFRRWTKGAERSPVCEGDIAVNDFLRARLPALAPDAGWRSEENEDDPAARNAATAWIVDPIDGTRAYITGRDDWTISVALVDGGRPVLAALYAPVTDEMFLAVRAMGATRNGATIRVNGGGLDGARLAGPKRTLDRLATLVPEVVPLPKIFSLALRLTRVAEGTLDAAFASHGGNDWDLAAADLLVHEAGGVMTDFYGRSLTYNRSHPSHGSLVAAGPVRHDALIELVSDRTAEFA